MDGRSLPDIVIEYSFYLLIFLVPIIWLPVNYELFEFNKMTLTYILATAIFGAWIFKGISERRLYIKRTPLDLVLLLFLAGNILATIFSNDPHMSIFGYYSRFNGGLLSTVTYIFLYYALVTHLDKEKAIKLLLVGFASSVLVAIYAIIQHPTPLFRNPDGSFRGIDAGYWDQNGEVRAFSTLGQPNWLAAYMAMFFFIGTSFLLTLEKNWQKLLILSGLALIFLGFTFTYSRGGTLGFVAGGILFLMLLFLSKPTFLEKIHDRILFVRRHIRVPKLGNDWRWFFGVIAIIVVSNLAFGNAFTKRGAAFDVSGSVTQLEIEGEQTGQIRLIVWKGALNTFKHYPIFGTGVETFAVSYYKFRPPEHNETGEWDFLYNKAHNEYLNYLSTTGIVGTLPYLALIIAFLFIVVGWLYFSTENKEKLLSLGLVSAYVSYLVQNVFGFSVVIIAILFFLIPGFFFIISDLEKSRNFVLLSEKNLKLLSAHPLWEYSSKLAVVILTAALVLLAINSWVADYYFAKGISGNTADVVYTNLSSATRLRPDEPLFVSELAAAEANLSHQVEDKDFAKKMEENSLKHIEKALSISPNNLGVWRNKLRVLFELVKVDHDRYLPDAIKTAEKVGELAPTDAKTQYNIALFYLLRDDPDYEKANDILKKVVSWRPQYLEARKQLVENYIDQGKNKEAKEQLNYLLTENPDDEKSLKLLKQLTKSD
ncbi:MAG: O-antigen ligase family protein [Candidatus Woykebacteria bacterium]